MDSNATSAVPATTEVLDRLSPDLLSLSGRSLVDTPPCCRSTSRKRGMPRDSLNGQLAAADDSAQSWLKLIFAATILVSAFLLFQVQPLISKYILPWFGGSPAVWTTCMLFFQIAYLPGTRMPTAFASFSRPGAGGVHLSLLAAAAVVMPAVHLPARNWKPIDSGDPTGRILLLLAATVGLPYFMLSTTGPLLQAWFARAWPGRSPYRLYALSNFGSLVALLTFPFVFVPAFTSDTQAVMWTVGFGVFAILCGLSAWRMMRLPRSVESLLSVASDAASVATGEAATVTHPASGRRLLWIALPACTSLMLLATTNFVCEDVAVIPFLWVVPLALYLLTFIICFDHPRWYQPLAMSVATLVLIMMSAGGWDTFLKWTGIHTYYLHDLVVYFTTMFFVCMVCHGQLVRLRPAADHLTEYYMLISAGGAGRNIRESGRPAFSGLTWSGRSP